MKVIFLDIDGVLNSDAWYHYTRALAKQNKRHVYQDNETYNITVSYLHSQIDDRAVLNLNYLIEHTGAKIVLSSSWKSTDKDDMRKLVKALKYKGLQFDDFLDITPFTESRNRGLEIKMWLDANVKQYNIESYCIFDDDIFDILPEQYDNFIHVDRHLGLTYIDTNKAFDILTKNNK